MGVHYRYIQIPGPVAPGETKSAFVDLGVKGVEITSASIWAPRVPYSTEGKTLVYLDCEPTHQEFSGYTTPPEVPHLTILQVEGDVEDEQGSVHAQSIKVRGERGTVYGQDNFPFYATGRISLNYKNDTDAEFPEDYGILAAIIYKDV